MDPAIQAELDRQQSSMLEKLSSIIDNKLDSMKRQLDKASTTQMSELKKIRLTEPRTFKKKGHKQQNKHNQQVKSVVSEAKDAVTSGKKDACIAKLNEGIELIDQRQKLILIAEKSEYGWKTVGEYLDNELADNDQDGFISLKTKKQRRL
jgi:GTPase involved in cell partitioning and DNA repair